MDGVPFTRGYPNRSMAKQARGRGRYRYRCRRDAGGDWDMENRVVQPCCYGAERTRQCGLSGAERAGCQPGQGSIPISIGRIGRIGAIGWRRRMKERAFSDGLWLGMARWDWEGWGNCVGVFWGSLVLAVGLMRGVSRRGRRRSQGGAAGGGAAGAVFFGVALPGWRGGGIGRGGAIVRLFFGGGWCWQWG